MRHLVQQASPPGCFVVGPYSQELCLRRSTVCHVRAFYGLQVMLQDFIDNKRVRLNAVVGLYPANATGDDIEVYEDDSRAAVKAKLFGLRQQVGGKGRASFVGSMMYL